MAGRLESGERGGRAHPLHMPRQALGLTPGAEVWLRVRAARGLDAGATSPVAEMRYLHDMVRLVVLINQGEREVVELESGATLSDLSRLLEGPAPSRIVLLTGGQGGSEDIEGLPLPPGRPLADLREVQPWALARGGAKGGGGKGGGAPRSRSCESAPRVCAAGPSPWPWCSMTLLPWPPPRVRWCLGVCGLNTSKHRCLQQPRVWSKHIRA
jgi:hypothetical protein